jgi:hypothetical protein
VSTLVTLTPWEMRVAMTVGALRHAEAVRQGRRDAHGYPSDRDGWGDHIEGAGGELAVARVLNVYWPASVNTWKAPDLGANVQVRTRSVATYDLLVRDDDADADVFVLVVGRLPAMRVVGWMVGADAKRASWRASHAAREPAFFVPQAELRPLVAGGGYAQFANQYAGDGIWRPASA